VEPVKGLDDAHRGAARPIEPARSGRFEVDDEFVEANRTQPGVRMNRDFRGHCVGKPELVGRRSSIWKKSGLFPPGDGVDDCGVVGAGRFAGKRVDAGNIVEPAINAPDVTGNREALECFVNG